MSRHFSRTWPSAAVLTALVSLTARAHAEPRLSANSLTPCGVSFSAREISPDGLAGGTKLVRVGVLTGTCGALRRPYKVLVQGPHGTVAAVLAPHVVAGAARNDVMVPARRLQEILGSQYGDPDGPLVVRLIAP